MNGSSKRSREEAEVSDEEDDDQPFLAPKAQRRLVVPGEQCPFLDTISRQNLDFDFEKCCSVSLSRVNVYACLVCGMYFQGRGPGTHAHTHSVEAGHHLFINTESGRVFCIPENYEVVDRSLKDIQHVLNPLYNAEDMKALANLQWARTIDGSDYMPGLVGLNNMKRNDYMNVVIQCLVRLPKLRDFFVLPEHYKDCESELVKRFGELVRKIWNARAFKGQVSPHEFLQAVINASDRRFTADSEADPVQFWTWLLNALHLALTGGKRKKSSIITKCFQGQLEITTLAGTGAAAGMDQDLVQTIPFFILSLDLPPARLFQDAVQDQIIPQVPLIELLEKYNGERVMDDVATGRRKFRVLALPQYLAMSVNRFTKNRFFVEKNPTIVNFPCRNLDMHPYLHEKPEDFAEASFEASAKQQDGSANGVTKVEGVRGVEGGNDREGGNGAVAGGGLNGGSAQNGEIPQGGKKKKKKKAKEGSAAQKTPEELEQERRQHKLKRKQMGLYNLLASVSHVGAKRPDGVYKVFMHRAGDGTWYEVQDLMIGETVQEAVVISEAYLQVYERAV